jgi:hypothetical protein
MKFINIFDVYMPYITLLSTLIIDKKALEVRENKVVIFPSIHVHGPPDIYPRAPRTAG